MRRPRYITMNKNKRRRRRGRILIRKDDETIGKDTKNKYHKTKRTKRDHYKSLGYMSFNSSSPPGSWFNPPGFCFSPFGTWFLPFPKEALTNIIKNYKYN